MRTLALLVLLALMPATAAAAQPLDPADLDALLAELEASGGILTTDELAALRLADPEPAPTRGGWQVALNARRGAPPRADLHAERRGRHWAGRLRLRRQAGDDRLDGWWQLTASGFDLALGGGTLVHGTGLLAASPGRRASLSTDASLLPPRPGWRSSTAGSTAATVRGAALSWSSPAVSLGLGVARDREGATARHLQLSSGAAGLQLTAGLVQRGGGQGLGLALDWRRTVWRLTAELARWRRAPQALPEQAWAVAARWRGGGWRIEGQAAASRAAAGLEGASRPACLEGWRGQGWALRVTGRLSPRLSVAAALGHGRRRDPEEAAGRLDERALLGLRVRGRADGGVSWELRFRRSEERRWRWDPLQPWRPAALDRRRSRNWLTALVSLPRGRDELSLSWRRLEEDGASRRLLAAVWIGRARWGRWRAGAHLAWGEALDLVAVSAPVPGLVRLRHWGGWQSGVLLGIGGGDRWRWELGGELRRRAPAASGPDGPALDILAAWGRSY